MKWLKELWPPRVKPVVNMLSITTKDGTNITWTVKVWPWTERIEPWKRFYKWFFGRTGPIFVMQEKDGETMLRRDDIVRFTVRRGRE